MPSIRSCLARAVPLVLLLALSPMARASDHLDTPSVIADLAADIGDLYAWMSPDGRRLNLVLDIVGRRFSDRIGYVFHVQSGRHVGRTTRERVVLCRFDADGRIDCRVGPHERVTGDASGDAGIASADGRVRVFAGLRNDPFFNNVKGTRQAYEVALSALKAGVARDDAGCPAFDAATTHGILDRWAHTSGGPAQDFLAGWTTSAVVVSLDVSLVDGGGPLLGVWAGTYALSDVGEGDLAAPVDRMGRTLTGNALIGLMETEDASNQRKEQYNRAAQADWPQFVPDIERALALYDGFDGTCGNQWRADHAGQPATRYHALATLLADDRLWVDRRAKACSRYMAVEQRALGAGSTDCGGRRPDLDAVDVYRSLLVTGREHGVDDGVSHDDATQPVDTFPFLAPP